MTQWDWQWVALTVVVTIVAAAPVLVLIGFLIWQRLNAWVQAQTQELRQELRDIQSQLREKSQTCDRLSRETEIAKAYAHDVEQRYKILNEQHFDLLIRYGLQRKGEQRAAADDDTGPRPLIPKSTENDVDLKALRALMEGRMEEDDLRNIAFDLEIGNFSRLASKSEQVQCIIRFLHKRGRLVRLFNWVAQYRPDISLDDIWR